MFCENAAARVPKDITKLVIIGKYFDSKFSKVSFSTPIKANHESNPTESLPNRANS